VQFIGRLRVTKYHYEGTVEEFRAVNFNLIGKGVSWELSYVSF